MEIAVIGCGVMGSAFARHFAKKHTVYLVDHHRERTEALAKEIGGHYCKDAAEALKLAGVILLAFKPKDLEEFAYKQKKVLKSDKIIVSILAGATVQTLKNLFECQTVRTMPNLAFICGQGVMGLVDDSAIDKAVKKVMDTIFDGVGLSVWMSENKLEALTALSGSGIAFVLVMIEAMIDSGVYLGFTAEESREYVLKTMEGAVALMRGRGGHPAELKLQISSPGGTTISGLKVMEENGVRAGIVQTVIACYEKALSMRKG